MAAPVLPYGLVENLIVMAVVSRGLVCIWYMCSCHALASSGLILWELCGRCLSEATCSLEGGGLLT